MALSPRLTSSRVPIPVQQIIRTFRTRPSVVRSVVPKSEDAGEERRPGFAHTHLKRNELEDDRQQASGGFKFVPLQMGVSEAGTAFLTGVLGLGTTLGTTLGLVRKVRMICWTGIGTLLLVRRGLSATSVLADPQLNRTPE